MTRHRDRRREGRLGDRRPPAPERPGAEGPTGMSCARKRAKPSASGCSTRPSGPSAGTARRVRWTRSPHEAGVTKPIVYRAFGDREGLTEGASPTVSRTSSRRLCREPSSDAPTDGDRVARRDRRLPRVHRAGAGDRPVPDPPQRRDDRGDRHRAVRLREPRRPAHHAGDRRGDARSSGSTPVPPSRGATRSSAPCTSPATGGKSGGRCRASASSTT